MPTMQLALRWFLYPLRCVRSPHCRHATTTIRINNQTAVSMHYHRKTLYTSFSQAKPRRRTFTYDARKSVCNTKSKLYAPHNSSHRSRHPTQRLFSAPPSTLPTRRSFAIYRNSRRPTNVINIIIITTVARGSSFLSGGWGAYIESASGLSLNEPCDGFSSFCGLMAGCRRRAMMCNITTNGRAYY